MLVVSQVCKIYGKGDEAIEALRDISLTVDRGEFVCIVGPSGAGKTTLLRCLTGLLSLTSGSITINGTLVLAPPPEIAVVFQDYGRSLMPWLTVGANVGLPLRNRIHDKTQRAARVEEALDHVGLAGFSAKYPWQLSGGMQQRVAIARGLAYQSEILLMDEPFASVDAQTRADLEDLVLRLRRESGLTVILVTHDIDEAVYLADRVVVVSKRPGTVLRDITIDLPADRDQVATKSLPRFSQLRAEVFDLIRRNREIEGASPSGTEGTVN
jgi:NitT/TauT family transport system ATP-binding protein